MKALINKARRLLRRVLGVPEYQYVIYKSDFPEGQLIGRPTQIGAFSIIDYGGTVKIGKNVKLGYGVVILSVSTITGSKDEKIIRKPVVIGDNRIGNNSTIGAGAVVVTDIPPNSVAAGVPAKIVKKKLS